MSKKLIALTIAAMLAGLPSPALSQANCRSSTELQAIAVRMLTTELMVAALGCSGTTEDSFRNRYGSFVQKFNPELVRNGSELKSQYARRGGESNPPGRNKVHPCERRNKTTTDQPRKNYEVP